MYWFILLRIFTIQYVLVQTSTDKYIQVCTGLYWYVLVHTSNSWIQKRCKQGSNPWSYAYFSYTSPLHCKRKAKEFLVSIKGNVGVYIKLVLFMSVYLALDDELTAPDPLHRPHRPWRPQRWPGLEPHDGTSRWPNPALRQACRWACEMCRRTAARLRNRPRLESWTCPGISHRQLGSTWCHQVKVPAFKMQVTLSRAVPVPVPLAWAHWRRPSQCSRDQCGQVPQLKPLGTKNKTKKNWRGNSMRTNELPAITGKVEHILLSSASGCCFLFDFLFLGYFCKSINLLYTAIFHINR